MSRAQSGYDKFFKAARRQAESTTPTPEQLVMQHLAERAVAKRKQRRQRRRPRAPIFASLLLLAAIAAGITGFWFPHSLDNLESVAQSWGLPTIDIGIFGLANASEKPADKKSEKSAVKGEASAASKPDAAKSSPAEDAKAEKSQDKVGEHDATKEADDKLDVRQWSAEELSFFKKLNEKKLQLDRREAELAKLEEELQKQREGLEEKIKQLESMRKQISTTLKDRVVLDQEKVAKLVDVYSNMKPNLAAKVIETINEDLAVTILDRMKKKNAAEILNTMSAAKARKLSELLTGYQVKGDMGSKEDRQPTSSSGNSSAN